MGGGRSFTWNRRNALVTTFHYIDPPFNFNNPDIAQYPAEVAGYRLLKSMADRLDWDSFRGRRLYDLGCGVRFARTIANLELDFDCYAGVDVNAGAIRWLQEHLSPPRFQFAHLDARNPLYNIDGVSLEGFTELPLRGRYDAVCMFSVITHQAPDEAAKIFNLIRRSIEPERLYFTALIDATVADYIEADPAEVRLLSTYHPDLVKALLDDAGWRIDAVYPPVALLQQTAFVCSPQ
jgi:SAM-dependent methyltransferase